jgi:dienelactone hydrolase
VELLPGLILAGVAALIGGLSWLGTRSGVSPGTFGWALAAIGGALLAGGCGSETRPTLSVTPREGLADTPLRIRVSGAPDGAVLRARATDARGRAFTSETSLADVRRDPAKPLWSLRHGDDHWMAPYPGFRVRLELRDGDRSLADATVVRQLVAPGVRGRDAADGLVGRFYEPAGKRRGAAVLAIGGSEGGLSVEALAALLASRGHPAMALAYFRAPGLPETLKDIPLEYFARALKRLRATGRPVFVIGISRGGEAALLLGATYPRLVQGVVALVPSNVVNGSTEGGASWTLHGRPVPYAEVFGDPAATGNPEAVIRAERTRGPILTVSGGRDGLWPSAGYAAALHERLDRRDFGFEHEDLTFPEAGHGVGGLPPYLPHLAVAELGGSPEADAAGKAEAWPRVLRLLDAATGR